MSEYPRLRALADPDLLPALKPEYAHRNPALGLGELDPPPRILLLYGSLRERSYSRLVVEESARLLQFFGCETRIFDPCDLPLPDQVKDDDHPAVAELRAHSLWSEAQVPVKVKRALISVFEGQGVADLAHAVGRADGLEPQPEIVGYIVGDLGALGEKAEGAAAFEEVAQGQ